MLPTLRIVGWEALLGELELVFKHTSVSLRCRVPLAIRSGDWFVASNSFNRAAYVAALAALAEGQSVWIPGSAPGYLAFAPLGRRRLRLCIVAGSQGLVTDVELRASDLLPSVGVQPG